MRLLALGMLTLLALGCGGTSAGHDAGPQLDAAPQRDGAVLDATPGDGAVGRPAREITTAGGHVKGNVFSVDVQIGHPTSQRPVGGGQVTVTPNTAVKP